MQIKPDTIGEPNNGPINGLAVWVVKQRKTAGREECVPF